jgi:transposase
MGNEFSKQAGDWREGRRLRGWELHEAGWSQAAIAEALGVTEGAVSQWMRRAREGGGPEALRTRTAPGAASRLSETQRARILDWLRAGPEAHGFRGELWTRKRVAAVIERKLGIRYHPGHVSKLLAQWAWSPQLPERRARQRDEGAIQEWLTARWPAIKNDGARGRAHAAVRR